MPFRSQRQRRPHSAPGAILVKPCAYCGTDYSVQCASRWERSKYCSKACRQRGRYASGEWDMSKMRKKGGKPDRIVERDCEACGERYIPQGQSQRWCRTCAPNFNWSRRIYRYGVTKPMWDEMLVAQGGTCALCDGEAVHVDHCHDSGRVRGLLCYSCNLRLSGLDDPIWRDRAEAYRAL